MAKAGQRDAIESWILHWTSNMSMLLEVGHENLHVYNGHLAGFIWPLEELLELISLNADFL